MELTVQLIAEICHEANRVIQKELGEPVNPPWPEASGEMQASAIDGVETALVGASPRGSHENWLAFKRENGWVYGEKKDDELKTHPCMVEYDELPDEQKFKDKLFTGIVSVFKEPV